MDTPTQGEVGGGVETPNRTLPENNTFDINRFFELRIQANEEWQKRSEVERYLDREIETDKPIAITIPSDLHVGSPGTAHLQLRDDFRAIAEHPALFAYIGGDWGNNYIVPKLIMAGVNDVFSAGDEQKEIVKYLFNFIARPKADGQQTVLAVGDGNHDNWLRKMANLDPLCTVLGELSHLFVGQGSVMRLKVGDITYKIFRRHRHRWSSVFNPAHAVVSEYQRNPFEFDIGIIEHQHISHYALFEGKEREDGTTDRISVRPGTYKLGDSFAEEHGFYYASNELVSIILWPDRFRMQPVKGLYQTIDLLDAVRVNN